MPRRSSAKQTSSNVLGYLSLLPRQILQLEKGQINHQYVNKAELVGQ
jgi:hypothetical protein